MSPFKTIFGWLVSPKTNYDLYKHHHILMHFLLTSDCFSSILRCIYETSVHFALVIQMFMAVSSSRCLPWNPILLENIALEWGSATQPLEFLKPPGFSILPETSFTWNPRILCESQDLWLAWWPIVGPKPSPERNIFHPGFLLNQAPSKKCGIPGERTKQENLAHL